MSRILNSASRLNRLVAAALVGATIALGATAAAAAQNQVGVSDPGYVPQARALLQPDPAATGEDQGQEDGNLRDERPKAAWEDCEPGDYWYMEGVDYSTPMLCK